MPLDGLNFRDRVRETLAQRSAFSQVRNAEREYSRHLRAVARHVGTIVRAFVAVSAPPTLEETQKVEYALQRYADTLDPWARAVAARMIQDVQRRDARAWRTLARKMGYAMTIEVETAPTGQAAVEAMARQIALITSLPRDAAERVRSLATTGYALGQRPGEMYNANPRTASLAREILRTDEVTVSRANLIARTEASRTGSELTKARATYVGSTHYVWRATKDRDTRPLHRALDGSVHAWDDPPIVGPNGDRSLPGAYFNCRCWAEPILPEKIV